MPKKESPPGGGPPAGAARRRAAEQAVVGTDRIVALTRLKGLLDAGILTPEQYESERRRLTEEQ